MLRALVVAAVGLLVATPTAATRGDAYRERRVRLLRQLGPGALAVLYGAAKLREGQRQRANFLYLTGLAEAGAVLVLSNAGARPEEMLFLAPRDPEEERWSGERDPLGSKVEKRTGFAAVMRTKALAGQLAALSAQATHLAFLGPVVGYDRPRPPELDLYDKLRARVPGLTIHNRAAILPAMRALKDMGELSRIRRATAITLEGHFEAWRAVRPGMTERDLKQRLDGALRKAGARRLAYPSIVGSGPRGTVLHSRRDDRVIEAGDLIVIDAAAEFEGYATDVTRTIPASGKFTAEQRRIYDVVLAAQKAALARVRPGSRLREEVHAAARRVIADAGHADAFIHGTSHFVGLRVHDAGDPTKPLAAGMVITVEPGIYLPEKKMGVRIEDTVIVTHEGHENLSAGLPREAEEIERWMAAARRTAP